MVGRVLIGAVVGGFCLAMTACSDGSAANSAKSKPRTPPAEQTPAPGPTLSTSDEQQQKNDGSGG